jgi:hypothetical protein
MKRDLYAEVSARIIAEPVQRPAAVAVDPEYADLALIRPIGIGPGELPLG